MEPTATSSVNPQGLISQNIFTNGCSGDSNPEQSSQSQNNGGRLLQLKIFYCSIRYKDVNQFS